LTRAADNYCNKINSPERWSQAQAMHSYNHHHHVVMAAVAVAVEMVFQLNGQ